MPATRRRTTRQFSLFDANKPDSTEEHAANRGALPPWLERFVSEAAQETETLRQNGAEQAAGARTALLARLRRGHPSVARRGTGEAAHELGTCEETVRRAVRAGRIPDRRAKPTGRIRVRRGDLAKLARASTGSYDPTADAQSIAQRRRKG